MEGRNSSAKLEILYTLRINSYNYLSGRASYVYDAFKIVIWASWYSMVGLNFAKYRTETKTILAKTDGCTPNENAETRDEKYKAEHVRPFFILYFLFLTLKMIHAAAARQCMSQTRGFAI